MISLSPSVVAAFLLVGMPAAFAADEFAALARFLPDDANAVIVVNAESLYASPLGQKEGWKAKYIDAFEAAPLILPPSAQRCVLAAEFELENLRPAWEAAAMHLSTDPNVADIAKRHGGVADVLDGVEAVSFRGRAWALKFGPQTFGFISPANRQEAARWAADAKDGNTGNLSPYLQQAVGYADKLGTQVVLAIDLDDAFSAAALKARLAQSDVLQGISPEMAAKILASLQGVKLGVIVDDKLNGALVFDFADDATPLAPIAKPIVLKAVAKAGAMLPEFNDWTAATKGRSIELKGELTADGMRRIFSLLALDAGIIETAPADSGEPSSSPAPPSAGPTNAGTPAATNTAPVNSPEAAKRSMGVASLRYFRGISKYVDDLQRLQRANSLDQAVMWIENYARKVEQLPTRNVDPDLIEYGRYVAQTFRQIVDQATGVLNEADAAQQPVVTNYRIGFLPTARTVNFGGNFQRMYAPYGNMDIDPQATQRNIQKSEDDIYQAVQKAQQSLAQLVADQATVRLKLNEKFYGLGLKF
jgi:hypothetical protein